jgi:isocitrate lyase
MHVAFANPRFATRAEVPQDEVDIVRRLGFDIRTADQAEIDRYNAEYDFCFLRGSNYIHAQMNWSRAAEVLRLLKIPVIADADTGHGGDAHVRNLVRRFVEAGVPGYEVLDTSSASLEESVSYVISRLE